MSVIIIGGLIGLGLAIAGGMIAGGNRPVPVPIPVRGDRRSRRR